MGALRGETAGASGTGQTESHPGGRGGEARVLESLGNWVVIQKNGSSVMQSRTLGGTEKSTLIEKELKQLEKIRLKQQKEIEQTVQYEAKMQEIRDKNQQKMTEQKER